MTTLHDELVVLSDQARRTDAPTLARTAMAAAATRRRRNAVLRATATVTVAGSLVLLRGAVNTPGVRGSAGSSRRLITLPATHRSTSSVLSSRSDIAALVLGAALGLLFVGIGARLRHDEDQVSPVERLVAGVWGATAGGWVVATFRLLRNMYREGTLATGHQELPIVAACAASVAIALALVLGTSTVRRLSVLGAAAVAVMELGGVVRPLADLGYWFDGGYWSAVWPEPLLAIRTAIGLGGLVWLMLAPLGRRGPSPWWPAAAGYVLLASGAADVIPHLTAYSYNGETWASVTAAAAAGLAGIALTAHLRSALHPASSVVVVATLGAYASPFVASTAYPHASLQQAWQWLPGAVPVLGVVLLPVIVWAWSSGPEPGPRQESPVS